MPTPFTDEDLDAAVAAGVLGAEAANGLRAFVEKRRATPLADEESFRLLTGFNDIFVALAIVMVLVALGWLVRGVGPPGHVVSWALVAAASWALAEFFTKRRRMALPSLVLLVAFVGAALDLAFGAAGIIQNLTGATFGGGGAILGGAFGVFAAWLHWRRFHVPITVAAGVAAAAFGLVGALEITGHGDRSALPAMAGMGLVAFGLALWWDASDRERKTRRADVAFWLHLTAAPLIVHPAFAMLGLSGLSLLSGIGPNVSPDAEFRGAALAVALYAALAFVALIVDRRALMVSALAYLLFAMNAFFRSSGALTSSFALSALIAGAGLLLIAAFWSAARRLALGLVPARIRALVPGA
ncbi:MAG: hypothetical protein ACLPN5_18490 [Roseiarcus sp.]